MEGIEEEEDGGGLDVAGSVQSSESEVVDVLKRRRERYLGCRALLEARGSRVAVRQQLNSNKEVESGSAGSCFTTVWCINLAALMRLWFGHDDSGVSEHDD